MSPAPTPTPRTDALWSRDRGSESLLAHARQMEQQAGRLAGALKQVLEHVHSEIIATRSLDRIEEVCVEELAAWKEGRA